MHLPKEGSKRKQHKNVTIKRQNNLLLKTKPQSKSEPVHQIKRSKMLLSDRSKVVARKPRTNPKCNFSLCLASSCSFYADFCSIRTEVRRRAKAALVKRKKNTNKKSLLIPIWWHQALRSISARLSVFCLASRLRKLMNTR